MPGSEPRRDHYDVVVVGSGIGGLTAAALLARAGLSVLVSEQQNEPGGYAHAFRRGPYTFDPAIHLCMLAGEGGLFPSVLDYLGVPNEVTWLSVERPYRAVFPDFQLTSPVGFKPYIEAHQRSFPGHAAEIETWVSLCHQMHLDIHQLPMSLSLSDLDAAAARFPTLFRYRTATVAEVLHDCVSDARLRAVLGTNWPYSGLPPSRLAFLPFAQILANMLEGTYHPEGGFQSLVDAFVLSLNRNGADIVLGNGARRILVSNGHVDGVVLEDGSEVRSRVVLSNADARHTFDDLVGDEYLPAPFLRRLHRMRPSLSAFVVFAATKLDLAPFDLAHEVFLNEFWDHDDAYAAILDGRPGGVWLSCPTLLDPSVSPPGEHLLLVSSMARYDTPYSWTERREAFAADLLNRMETVTPGVGNALTYVENATPLTLHRYSRNQAGACYGWEPTPAQAVKRLPHATPVDGLYLSGHWTQPSSSSSRVFASGIHTAFMVQQRLIPDSPLPTFADANLPSLG